MALCSGLVLSKLFVSYALSIIIFLDLKRRQYEVSKV